MYSTSSIRALGMSDSSEEYSDEEDDDVLKETPASTPATTYSPVTYDVETSQSIMEFSKEHPFNDCCCATNYQMEIGLSWFKRGELLTAKNVRASVIIDHQVRKDAITLGRAHDALNLQNC